MTLRLYTDGGCIGRNPSEHGGTWAYLLIGENDTVFLRDYGIILPFPGHAGTPKVTNNQSELYAMMMGLDGLHRNGWTEKIIHVFSDSDITLGRVFRHYAFNGISPAWVDALKQYKRQLHYFKRYKYTLLAGHPTKAELRMGKSRRNGNPVSKWNVLCDEMCQELAREFLGATNENP